MKKHIIILSLLITVKSFASFESFTAKFDSLLVNDPWGEMTLEYDLFTNNEDDHNELSSVVSYIMNEKTTLGLTEMKMKPYYTASALLDAFGKTYGDYYCYRLVSEFNYGSSEGECNKKLKEIIEAAFADKSVDSVSLLELDGDYYGDWSTNFLLLQDYNTNETLIVEFDLIHEI